MSLHTLCPEAHVPAKGSPPHCGLEGSSESGREQWEFGVDVVDEVVPLENWRAAEAVAGVGCRRKRC